MSSDADNLVYEAKMAGRTLLVTGIVAVAAVLARITDASMLDLTWWKASISRIWIFFVAASIVHLWYTIWISVAVRNMVAPADIDSDPLPDAECRAVFDRIVTQESPFLNGLIPRHGTGKKSRFVRMSPKDPTTWLAYFLVLGIIAANLPWTLHAGSLKWLASREQIAAVGSLAAVLVVFNWLCAGLWTASISQLALPADRRWPIKHKVIFSGFVYRTNKSSKYVSWLILICVPLTLILAPIIAWVFGP